MVEEVTFADFQKLVIRVGEIIRAEEFPEARKPAIKLWVNFENEIGIKKSSAQIKDNYKCTDLIGRRVLAVINFAPRQIGKFMSEVLVLGVPDKNKQVILIVPDEDVPIGGRVY